MAPRTDPTPPLQTQWLTLRLPVAASPGATIAHIEAATRDRGELLRWAITAVDPATQEMTIEAVVLG